jgi:thymidylate kinase
VRAADAPGKFLVLLGTDGSGKSTVLSRVRLPGLVTASWRDLRSHDLPAMLAADAPTHIKDRLPGLSRAMFIGGHLVAQYEYLVRPQTDIGNHVLLDSYYFKLLAKERLLGTVHPVLEELCAELPAPDGVIYLDVPAHTGLARKAGAISSYECFGEPTPPSFLTFQTRLAAMLKDELARLPHVVVSGDGPPAAVVALAEDAAVRLAGPALTEARVANR